jgi:predicted  nucleic acid-binding Zn-ribbon protein
VRWGGLSGMAGRCTQCGAEFGTNVWDLVIRQGACPHCGGELKNLKENEEPPRPEEPGGPSA